MLFHHPPCFSMLVNSLRSRDAKYYTRHVCLAELKSIGERSWYTCWISSTESLIAAEISISNQHHIEQNTKQQTLLTRLIIFILVFTPIHHLHVSQLSRKRVYPPVAARHQRHNSHRFARPVRRSSGSFTRSRRPGSRNAPRDKDLRGRFCGLASRVGGFSFLIKG